MSDTAKAKALEIGAEMARKENAGSRYEMQPARVGEIAAEILNALESKLDKTEGHGDA